MKTYKVEKDFMVDGYRCLVVGQSLGHRCGYVGIPTEHLLYGKDYDDININVHGGLTYYSDSKHGYPVDDNNLWWIGFDCAHYGDSKDIDLIKELADEEECKVMLDMERRFSANNHGIVRTKEYVEEQLLEVVEQLKIILRIK